ncbi:hypothetical protein EIN_448500 [Entamoeba invadens IP1]|uniref:Surface antigen BspA-like n=1 Tax=Entamoeba invadens IP1 TaxID=370355 RepID=L7FMK1_ENTIV|nr:hypothetical protein EIN_448500 [Entamoeba invadens IP1]ELP89089.1 hypothetical protein EIN_448500 [Entamoeba invadens IP1]|eukprot:XP_004255860.1 hypothetical protein EIN_448500 [Entamoeba invadens IP1]
MKSVILFLCIIYYSVGQETPCYTIDYSDVCVRDVSCEGAVVIGPGYPPAICKDGFKGNTKITSVKYTPKGEMFIKASAFEGATNLEYFESESPIEVMEEKAFKGCTSLKSINVGTVTEIQPSCFEGCSSLITVDNFDKITIFNTLSFSGTGLTEITFGNSVKKIVSDAFKNTKLKDIIFGNTAVTMLESGAFKDMTTLISVDLGGNTEIPDNLFMGCTSLGSVKNIDKVTSFGVSSFERTSLKEIVFGNTVTKMGNGAFKEVGSLSITLPSTQIGDFGPNVFENSRSLSQVYYSGNTIVPDFTFRGCTSLAVLKGSENIISFGVSSFENTKLNNIVFAPNIKKLGDNAFKATSFTTITLPDTNIEQFGVGVFENIKTLKSVTVGGTTTIPQNTFKGCENMNTVSGSEKITSFGENCFDETSLTKITFGDKVDKIGSSAFVGTLIGSVRLPKRPVDDFGEGVFLNCLNLDHVYLGGTKKIPPHTFERCSTMSQLRETEMIEFIGKDAFKGCTNLVSINLFGNLETLLDSFESINNVFYHGTAPPKTLPTEPPLKTSLRVFVTNFYKPEKFGEIEVKRLNCSITQFVDVSQQNVTCQNCAAKMATLDGDNYMCDIDMTACINAHAKCQICLEDKCRKCDEKLFVDTTKDVCVAECPSGYYDGAIQCEKCKDHYEKPCKDAECEKCTGGVIGTMIVGLVITLLFLF